MRSDFLDRQRAKPLSWVLFEQFLKQIRSLGRHIRLIDGKLLMQDVLEQLLLVIVDKGGQGKQHFVKYHSQQVAVNRLAMPLLLNYFW